MTTTTTPKRHRNRWTVSELNNLHSEYEMKELTVQEIASIHGRTMYGIMNKLQSEGLIDSMDNARGWVFQSSEQNQSFSLQPAIQFDDDCDDDEDCEQDDDPNDEDYVPEDDEDMDVEDEDASEPVDDEDFDPYSIKQKVVFLEKQINNIYSFLQTAFPKQKTMVMAK